MEVVPNGINDSILLAAASNTLASTHATAPCNKAKAKHGNSRTYREAAYKIERSALAPKPAAAPNAVQVGVKRRVAVVPLGRHVKIHHQCHLSSPRVSLPAQPTAHIVQHVHSYKYCTWVTSKPRDSTSVDMRTFVVPSRNSCTTRSRASFIMLPSMLVQR